MVYELPCWGLLELMVTCREANVNGTSASYVEHTDKTVPFTHANQLL